MNQMIGTCTCVRETHWRRRCQQQHCLVEYCYPQRSTTCHSVEQGRDYYERFYRPGFDWLPLMVLYLRQTTEELPGQGQRLVFGVRIPPRATTNSDLV
ncbi:MAG: hypothetical protein CM15mP68_0070 [Pseudomonadota bacterium]|nr:MAG: hypothetical protein CM15mP68_0070 [Pseudomonadota bacterium]